MTVESRITTGPHLETPRETEEEAARKRKLTQIRAAYNLYRSGDDFDRRRELRIADTQEVVRYLGSEQAAELQFSPTLSPDKTQVIGLEWLTKQKDFIAFKKIFFLLMESSLKDRSGLFERSEPDGSREKFPSLLDKIIKALDKMPLFVALDRRTIKVSPAHTGTTPAQHTINVIGYSDLNQYTEEIDKKFEIFNMIWHDLGKNCIADGDFTQKHAEISKLILREFYRLLLEDQKAREIVGRYLYEDQRSILNFGIDTSQDASLIEELCAPVKYHHALELLEMKYITVEELIRLLKSDVKVIKHTASLAMADRMSVQKHYPILALTAYAVYALLLENLDAVEDVSEILELVNSQLIEIVVAAGKVAEFPNHFVKFIEPVLDIFGSGTTQQDFQKLLGNKGAHGGNLYETVLQMFRGK